MESKKKIALTLKLLMKYHANSIGIPSGKVAHVTCMLHACYMQVTCMLPITCMKVACNMHVSGQCMFGPCM